MAQKETFVHTFFRCTSVGQTELSYIKNVISKNHSRYWNGKYGHYHAHIENYNKYISVLEQTTLFPSTYYKHDVRLIQYNELPCIVTAALDIGAGPYLIIKDEILISLMPLIRPTKTFWRSTGDNTFNVSGVLVLRIDFVGEAAYVVLEAVSLSIARMIPCTALIDKSAKSIEPERRSIVLETDQPDPILLSIKDTKTTHIGLAEIKKDKEKTICETAKLKTIVENWEAILSIKTKLART